jgi:hypothetical protein
VDAGAVPGSHLRRITTPDRSSRSTQASITATLDATIKGASPIVNPAAPQTRAGSEHPPIVLRFEPNVAQIVDEPARALRFHRSRAGLNATTP